MSFYKTLIARIYRVLLITLASSRMESADLISAASVFDPRHFPATEEELSNYGMDKIVKLTDFYGIAQKVHFNGKESESEPDVDPDDTEAEWKLFRWLIFKQYRESSIYQVLTTLISNGDIVPNCRS